MYPSQIHPSLFATDDLEKDTTQMAPTYSHSDPNDRFLRRPSTWIAGFFGCVAAALAGWWWISSLAGNAILAQGARHQYDSAWTKLDGWHWAFSECGRQGVAANLAALDDRTDTLLLRMTDSLKVCRLPKDSLFELVSLGYLRIARHAKGLDTSELWRIQGTAFRAASDCIKIDSSRHACLVLGYQALVAMEDTASMDSWLGMARSRWPKDPAFEPRKGIQPRTDTVRRGKLQP